MKRISLLLIYFCLVSHIALADGTPTTLLIDNTKNSTINTPIKRSTICPQSIQLYINDHIITCEDIQINFIELTALDFTPIFSSIPDQNGRVNIPEDIEGTFYIYVYIDGIVYSGIISL